MNKGFGQSANSSGSGAGRFSPLLSLCLAFVFLFVSLYFFTTRANYSASLEIPPCFRIGGDWHHYFEPNCVGISSPSGVSYSINEFGLRDRNSSTLGKGGALVLGDSVVEGKGLPFGSILSQVLERKMGMRFINAGVRSRGPVIESLLLEQLIPKYDPTFVVWVLSENDVFDDRIAYAMKRVSDENGVPVAIGTDDFDRVATISKWRARFGGRFFDSILYLTYRWNVERLAKAKDSGYEVCGGIRRGVKLARKSKLPILFVLTPLGPNNPYQHFTTDFNDLLPCLSGEKVIDLRQQLNRAELFLPKDTHLNEEGMKYFAELLSKDIGKLRLRALL